jgi:hypothetical protein
MDCAVIIDKREFLKFLKKVMETTPIYCRNDYSAYHI